MPANPLEALLAAAKTGKVSLSGDNDGPKNFTFETDDAAFEHIRKFKDIEFGDEVIVHRNDRDIRAVFVQWDERGFLVLSYRDEENNLNGMGCPMSCVTRVE